MDFDLRRDKLAQDLFDLNYRISDAAQSPLERSWPTADRGQFHSNSYLLKITQKVVKHLDHAAGSATQNKVGRV